MKLLMIYRVLSFLLLPVAALFALVSLLSIITSLTNPAFLVPAFLFTSVVIYTYCSFRFLIRGIDGQKVCKSILKDWIRINSFISLLFSMQAIASIIFVLKSQKLRDLAIQVYNMYPKGIQEKISVDQVQKMEEGVLIFFFIYSVILLTHIFISRFYIRKYAYLFEEA